MYLDAPFTWFWSVVLRGLLSLTGSDNIRIGQAAAIISIYLNVPTYPFTRDPLSLMMWAGAVWLIIRSKAIKKGLESDAEVIGIPLSDVKLIMFGRFMAMLWFFTRLVFTPAFGRYWPAMLLSALGALLFAASGYFILDFQPPRKSLFRRVHSWLKSRNWSLGGGHLPAPTPI